MFILSQIQHTEQQQIPQHAEVTKLAATLTEAWKVLFAVFAGNLQAGLCCCMVQQSRNGDRGAPEHKLLLRKISCKHIKHTTTLHQLHFYCLDVIWHLHLFFPPEWGTQAPNDFHKTKEQQKNPLQHPEQRNFNYLHRLGLSKSNSKQGRPAEKNQFSLSLSPQLTT